MKKFCLLIIVLFLATCVMGTVSFLPAAKPITVSAYTEKQKKQVKAWLSAHGYPPTMEGAYQAYQDYLSGKLTLSEKEQKLVTKNIGKTPKKKKKKTEKKANSKKKKSSKKNSKAAVTPQAQTSEEEESEEEKKMAVLPTPSVVNESTADGKEVGNINKCATDDSPQIVSGNFWKGIFFYIGGGVILLSVSVVIWVCRRKQKGSRRE